jgi:uncharacterized membrane protein YeaQ/YmgE (transglycosylase-associated protein family)
MRPCEVTRAVKSLADTAGKVCFGSSEVGQLRHAGQISHLNRVQALTRSDTMIDILGFIVFGLVVGAVARLIKPGRQNLSILMTLLLGLAGSVIGGLVASLIGSGDIFELNIIGAIVAIVAAVLLIGVAEGMSGRNKSSV